MTKNKHGTKQPVPVVIVWAHHLPQYSGGRIQLIYFLRDTRYNLIPSWWYLKC